MNAAIYTGLSRASAFAAKGDDKNVIKALGDVLKELGYHPPKKVGSPRKRKLPAAAPAPVAAVDATSDGAE